MNSRKSSVRMINKIFPTHMDTALMICKDDKRLTHEGGKKDAGKRNTNRVNNINLTYLKIDCRHILYNDDGGNYNNDQRLYNGTLIASHSNNHNFHSSFTVSFITVPEPMPLTLLNVTYIYPVCALDMWNYFISSWCLDFVFNRNVGGCKYLLIEACPPAYTFLNRTRFSGLGGKVGVIHKWV